MKRPQRSRRPQRSPRGGFTLLEVTIVATLLLFGLMAVSTTGHSLRSLRDAEDEQVRAQNALDSVVRSIQAVAASHRGSSDGWSVAFTRSYDPAGEIAPTFPVVGLDPWQGAPSVGLVELVLDETLTDDEIGFVLGMPQDLDGDGAIVSADVSATAQLLPLVVRVRWQGAGGRRELVQGVYVSEF